MGRKLVLEPFIALNENVAATKDTAVTDAKNLDELTYLIEWSSGTTPDIDISLYSSISKIVDAGIPETYVDLGLSPVPNITGASGNHLIVIDAKNLGKVKLTLTRNSGNADVKVTVIGKVLGA